MGIRKRMDRISDLPDEVISHILSSLPIKESALTSLLSTRWRNLFAFRPNLHLHDDLEDAGCGQSFVDFVDGVLAASGNLPFRNVSIKCRKTSMDSGHATRWMTDLLRRGGLVNLDLDLITYDQAISVPPEMFTCKTIVELKLAKGFYALLPEDVYLPSLKTLSLGLVFFRNTGYCVLGKLLPACPVLEELTIRCDRWQIPNCCRTVSSSTLKKLTIICTSCHCFWGITFDTLNLAYLEYSDLAQRDYPFVNLESLVEAKLNLRLIIGNSNPTNLIKGLRNVEVLELSVDTSEMIYHFREAIPVFSNLLHLSITIDSYGYGWEVLPALIRNSPNLQTLVIKGPLYPENRRREYGSSCPVKVLKITEYGGKLEELKQMKRLINKLPHVELVKVRVCPINDKKKSRVTEDLLGVPRSSKCKIQIKFSENTEVMHEKQTLFPPV